MARSIDFEITLYVDPTGGLVTRSETNVGKREASWPTVREHVLAALARHGVEGLDVRYGHRTQQVLVGRGSEDREIARAGIRRDTIEHLLEDADALAREAAGKLAAEPKPCPECAIWGEPKLGSCSTCGKLGSEVEQGAALLRSYQRDALTEAAASLGIDLSSAQRESLRATEGVFFRWTPHGSPSRQHAADLSSALPPAPMARATVDEPPPGYTFEIDCDGDVWVVGRRMDGGLYYYGPKMREKDAAYQRCNELPERWLDHEPARQWAAKLLGETAPPLRTEGDEPRTFDRCQRRWTFDGV